MSSSVHAVQRPASKELQAIARVLVAQKPVSAVLATLVKVEGSSYRRAGARLLRLADGTRLGSISGGCLEEDILTRAGRVSVSGEPETVIYDTTSENDLVWGVGMGCHGVVRVLIERLPENVSWARTLADNFSRRQTTHLAVAYGEKGVAPLGTSLAAEVPSSVPTVFLETITAPTHLCVFGAGDDAQPLVRLAKELGWFVSIADPRAAFATVERFPVADRVVIGPPEELPTRANIDSETVAVVMTHHYVHDVPLLRALLPLQLPYLGLLGPRKRADKIISDLTTDGTQITQEQRARLHAPVGLDLGADAPEQVALAITAEIQAVLTRRNGQPLRQRTQPIHQ